LKYLLDTNVLSEPVRPQPRSQITDWLDAFFSDCATSSVVWHELSYGARRLPESRKRQALLRYLKEVVEPHLPILAYDFAAAEWHSVERARLANLGLTPPAADAQIASVAVTQGLTLVTFNGADYRHFAGLQIENPLKA